jgi:hypothetical protein
MEIGQVIVLTRNPQTFGMKLMPGLTNNLLIKSVIAGFGVLGGQRWKTMRRIPVPISIVYENRTFHGNGLSLHLCRNLQNIFLNPPDNSQQFAESVDRRELTGHEKIEMLANSMPAFILEKNRFSEDSSFIQCNDDGIQAW